MTEETIAKLELRVARLEGLVAQLADVWMPAVRKRLQGLEARSPEAVEARALEALEARVKALEDRPAFPADRPKRKRINWQDYVKLNAMCDRGASVNSASKALGVAYTTCYRYRYLSPDAAEALRLEWEADNPPFTEADVDGWLLNRGA